MTKEQYFEKAKYIWKNFVPKSGQADTIQGELLRAIEKLRDEAQRNGNINFNPNCHVILINYLQNYLLDNSIFEQPELKQIEVDLIRLLSGNDPYLEDDLYDRINDRIADWYIANPNGALHKNNPDLYC